MPARSVRTPIGELGLVGSDIGLTAVHWTADSAPRSQSSALLDRAADQLVAYFAHNLEEFDVELDLDGTEFQCRCWRALAKIPFGQTVSYAEQARRLGLPTNRARAVGAANGRNPVPIV